MNDLRYVLSRAFRNRNRLRVIFFAMTLAVTFIAIESGVAHAQTTAFTYQGKLTDTGIPANGQYDLKLQLFDAATGGTAYVTVMDLQDVVVTNGILTVSLDFGSLPFQDQVDKWLEIAVRPGASTGAYNTLTPRQQINTAPFAIQANKASEAQTADAMSSVCNQCITDAHIVGLDGNKVFGTVANAANAMNAATAQTSVTAQTATTAINSNNLGGVSAGNYLQVNGNGSQLTNVVGTFKWNVIGGDQQAERNNGYLINSNSLVTINLPTAPQIGDIIRIADSDTDPAGWRITINAGQTILRPLSTQSNLPWTPREANRDWASIASSADGTKAVAVAYNGKIYTSTDSGMNWIPRESDRQWRSVASSADGTKLAAAAELGQIYTSVDSGVTWIPRETDRNWFSVASSADGTKLVAVVLFGQIYTSVDSGLTWTPRETNRGWYSVASSADGTKLVAIVGGGQIYTSVDSGVTWTPREANRGWKSVASSADGTTLIAAGENTNVYRSTDSGVSWAGTSTPIKTWNGVALSADGTKMVAVAQNDYIYTSLDSGITWIQQLPVRFWGSVASSADGSILFAGTGGGQIYVNNSRATTEMTGGRGSSVELVYLGDGKFYILNSQGSNTGF